MSTLSYTYPSRTRDAIVTALEAAEKHLEASVTRAARDSDYLGAGHAASVLTLVTAALEALDAADATENATIDKGAA